MTGDSWYSGVDNLKRLKNHALGWLFAIESNRTVSATAPCVALPPASLQSSVDKGNWTQVQKLDIPDDGLLVWLKNYGNVKLFRIWLKDQPRHYAVFLPDDDQLAAVGRKTFTEQHDKHWHIEQYHRAIKQVCNIEKFPPQGWSMDSAQQNRHPESPVRRPMRLCPAPKTQRHVINRQLL